DYLEFPEYQRILLPRSVVSLPHIAPSMKAILSCVFLSLFLSGNVLSEEPVGPPDWMKDITRLPPGDHVDLRAVALEYTLDWNNRINAGRVNIAIVNEGSRDEKFVGDASGRSTGFARL